MAPTIAQQALSRALQYLAAVPGVFCRIELDGVVVADTFPKAAERPKAKRTIQHNFARDVGYTAALKALQSGQSLSFARQDHPILAEEKTWLSFVSSVKSTANKYYRPEDFLWEVSKEKLTLLYIKGDV